MRLFAAAVSVWLVLSSPQPSPGNPNAVIFHPPYGEANRVLSPGGRHALWGDRNQTSLWIEDIETGKNRLVGQFTIQTVAVSWSPGARYFVVNDRPTSTEANTYLFNTETLSQTRLRDKLIAASPDVRRYLLGEQCSYCGVVTHGRSILHSYLDVRRWVDEQHMEIQLNGNFGGRFRRDDTGRELYPAGCFDVRFNLALDGTVRKLSEHLVEQLSEAPACGWDPGK